MTNTQLIKLLEDIRSCDHCRNQLPLGPRPVVIAKETAKLLIIGQAPGTKVHASGIPWDDPSGKRLRQWLDITDEEFYNAQHIAIMPMGFCYPGKGKSGDLPPRPECAPLWHQKIRAHLPAIELTLLIGQYAQKYYLPKDKLNLTERVKTHFGEDKKTSPFLPLPHPSPRNTLWLKKNPWFEKNCLPILKNRVKSSLR